MTEVCVRSIADVDLRDAVEILIAGSREPHIEDLTRLNAYADAVTRTRATGGDVLVATVDGAVVGLCQVLLLPHFQHAGGLCAEIESVHVRTQWRRHGVGSALLAAAETYARAAHCYRIQLTSHDSRAEAHLFYATLGYEASHVGFKKVFSPGS